MLRALALVVLLAAWPAGASTIYKDGFEPMSQVVIPLHFTSDTGEFGGIPRTLVSDPVPIPPTAVSVARINVEAFVLLWHPINPVGPPLFFTTTNVVVTTIPEGATASGSVVNLIETNGIELVAVVDNNPTSDLEAWRDRRISIKVTPVGSAMPPYEYRVIDVVAFITFNFPPDYRMTASSSATAGRTDRINIAPRLGGQQGSSFVNVVVNLGSNRRETSFTAESGSVFAVPRAAPSMRGLVTASTTMAQGLLRRRPVSFTASSGTTFTLPASFGIGAALQAAGSSSVTANVNALRRLSASFVSSASASGSTIKIASVTVTATSGTVMLSGLSAAQQFLVSFTAESGSQWNPAINILAPFTLVGSSSAAGPIVNLYRGPADFNVDSTEGWSMNIDASEWSVWV